jgi:hypothetical protein
MPELTYSNQAMAVCFWLRPGSSHLLGDLSRGAALLDGSRDVQTARSSSCRSMHPVTLGTGLCIPGYATPQPMA